MFVVQAVKRRLFPVDLHKKKQATTISYTDNAISKPNNNDFDDSQLIITTG